MLTWSRTMKEKKANNQRRDIHRHKGWLQKACEKKKKNKNLINKRKRQDFFFFYFTGEVKFPAKLHWNSSDYWVIKIFQEIPFSFLSSLCEENSVPKDSLSSKLKMLQKQRVLKDGRNGNEKNETFRWSFHIKITK